jgi:hypothetical protein
MCFMGVVWKMTGFGELPWKDGLRRYNQEALQSSYAEQASNHQSVLDFVRVDRAPARQHVGGA